LKSAIKGPLKVPQCLHLKVTLGGPARISINSQRKPLGKALWNSSKED